MIMVLSFAWHELCRKGSSEGWGCLGNFAFWFSMFADKVVWPAFKFILVGIVCFFRRLG